ncbi:MAG: apolipoprotein N-acyltransferase [Acidobacteriota bacterium]|nr:apolipoprotein N-acyltransferase [Acidobacteriota bacterium]
MSKTAPLPFLHRAAEEQKALQTKTDSGTTSLRDYLKITGLAGTGTACLILAAPPVNLQFLAFIGIACLFAAVRQTRARTAGAVFLLSFTTLLLVTTAWWQPTLMRIADLSPAKAWTVTALLSLWQAIPYALWGLTSIWLLRRFRLPLVLTAPLLFVVAETAFPFPLKLYLAITVSSIGPVIQLAELGGPPAVFAPVVLGGILMAEAGALLIRRQPLPSPIRWGAAVFLVLFCAGWLRQWQVNSAAGRAESLSVGVVQANFGNLTQHDREYHGKKLLENLRRATVQLGDEGAQLVVWPEAAWPFLLDRTIEREFPKGHPWALRKGYEGRLLTGALSHRFGGDTLYNSAVLIAEDGRIAGRHDKRNLVPFAERVPFQKRFPEWASRWKQRLDDQPELTPGGEARILDDGALKTAAFICSEDLDGKLVRNLARQGPNLLTGIASDAWFGTTAAAEQHMRLALFRSVETRRAMVRAANTGVSALISPTGKVLGQTEVVQGAPDGSVPPVTLAGTLPLMTGAAPGPTLIPIFPWLCLAALGSVVAIRLFKA